MAAPSWSNRRAFTLIELLVVVAIIGLLLAILLPSLSAAREQARTAVCSVQLRQIGIAQAMYADISRGWLVGSPNTSGNGARRPFDVPDNYVPEPETCRAAHVFDWANPLLLTMGFKPPRDAQPRYAAAVSPPLQCPSNLRQAGPGTALGSLIPAGSLAPSYAISRFFTYVGTAAKTGDKRGDLWWSDDCVPTSYLPKTDHIRRPQGKAFLADAHVVASTDGRIVNPNWGFASQGAWRCIEAKIEVQPGEPKVDPSDPVTYRGSFLREQMWRHRGAIDILAFDGHVERQPEGGGDGRDNDNFGSGARRARWWFPSGTNTKNLPERRAGTEPALIVP